MKHIHFRQKTWTAIATVLAAAAFAVTLSSCSKGDDGGGDPTPVITIETQPVAPAGLVEGNIPANTKLTVEASVTLDATLSYQWYTYDPVEDELFEAIEGATGKDYIIPTDLTEGTYYYVCEVSAPKATPVQTAPVLVTVESPDIALSDPEDKEQPAYADEEASKGFTFTAKSAWTATVEEITEEATNARAASSGVSWLRLKVNGEEMYSGAAGEIDIAIELDINYTGATRSATITITSGTDDILVTVTQQGTTEQGEVPKPSYSITQKINNSLRGSFTITDAQGNPITSAKEGDQVTVTAHAETGSEFYYWTVFRQNSTSTRIPLDTPGDDTDNPNDTDNPMTFTMRAYDVEINALFIDDVSASSASDAVMINGVRWATRNVDATGTFAAKPENYGQHYRWNNSTGFAPGDDFPVKLPPTSINFGSDWSSANSPCPEGWRIPAYDEMLGSLETTSLTPREWILLNGVRGMRYVEESTGNAVFLPAAGWRPNSDNGSLNNSNEYGRYWTSSRNSIGDARYMVFTSNGTTSASVGYPPGPGHSVRCVK
ncbi:MAG: hypothetical protein LBR65_05875 [Culturomica sp.]|jgi:uncharacterized protein (TIGR02145 family)|nr:hypothetical protein [Culturomica sp.]